MTANIHFLTSYPKSGNTWCRVFLVNYIRKADEPVPVNEFSGDIPVASSSFYVGRWTGVESSILTESEVASLRKEGLLACNRKLEKPSVVKVHDAFPRDAEPDWFPAGAVAGVIYIVRNPLDVAKSLANHLGVSVDKAVSNLNDADYAFSAARYRMNPEFKQTLHSWSEHVLSWLDGYKGPLCLVRYEDLLADPLGEFGRIVRAAGLEYDEERLRTAIRNSDFKVLRKDEDANGFGGRPITTNCFFREGKAGTWRKYLSEQNVRDIVDCHREVMTRLGYLDEMSC